LIYQKLVSLVTHAETASTQLGDSLEKEDRLLRLQREAQERMDALQV